MLFSGFEMIYVSSDIPAGVSASGTGGFGLCSCTVGRKGRSCFPVFSGRAYFVWKEAARIPVFPCGIDKLAHLTAVRSNRCA